MKKINQPALNLFAPAPVFALLLGIGLLFGDEKGVPVAKRAGPDWWSLQPIRRTTPPTFRRDAQSSDWARSPIDALVLQNLIDNGLRPAPEADRAPYIRRATFDLLGLPPTPEEVQTFVNDSAPDAYEKLIDRLLAS